MKKQHLVIVVVTAFITLFVFLTISLIVSQQTPENPAGTVGNTAGNLNNSGMFCESNGKVYFSNTFDGGSLYAMNSNESEIEKINNQNVRNLLIGGEYIYYYQLGNASEGEFAGLEATLPDVKSFIRCKADGTQATTLTRNYVQQAQLADSQLYLLVTDDNGTSFYKTDLNGVNQTLLAAYSVNPSCVYNGKIYYNGTGNNHYLYALNTQTDVAEEVWQGNLWYPAIEDDYVYFLDVTNNYRLCRYSLSGNVIEILTHDRVDCFNVGHGYIYYQKNSASNPQLICMRSDGTDRQVVAEGNYTHINMTSQYVYFQEFGDERTLYHCPLGSIGYRVFSAAEQAVAK